MFSETVQSIQKIHHKIRKKFSNLSRTKHSERANLTLAHLLCLASYNADTDLRSNTDVYKNINNLMTSAKSLLMKYTGLTDRIAGQMTYEDDVSNDKALAALGKMAALEGQI